MTQSNLNKTIKFIQYHVPALESGIYYLNLTQTTGGTGEGGSVTDTFTVSKTFAVMGQRFILSPNKIHSVFPASNHQGDFSNCFPHIVFTSTTLPWQRFLNSS